MDADGADVVGEHLAQLVVAGFADEGRAPAEAGDAGDAVGRRTARGLPALGHGLVEGVGPAVVDQGHAALGQILLGDEVVAGRRDHVDDGVADGGDVIKVRHGRRLPGAQRGGGL